MSSEATEAVAAACYTGLTTLTPETQPIIIKSNIPIRPDDFEFLIIYLASKRHTGGDDISQTFQIDNRSLIIVYESSEAADRVLKKRFHKFKTYILKASIAFDHNNNSNEKLDVIMRKMFTSCSNILIIKNLNFLDPKIGQKDTEIAKLYAEYLIDEENSVDMIEFPHLEPQSFYVIYKYPVDRKFLKHRYEKKPIVSGKIIKILDAFVTNIYVVFFKQFLNNKIKVSLVESKISSVINEYKKDGEQDLCYFLEPTTNYILLEFNDKVNNAILESFKNALLSIDDQLVIEYLPNFELLKLANFHWSECFDMSIMTELLSQIGQRADTIVSEINSVGTVVPQTSTSFNSGGYKLDKAASALMIENYNKFYPNPTENNTNGDKIDKIFNEFMSLPVVRPNALTTVKKTLKVDLGQNTPPPLCPPVAIKPLTKPVASSTKKITQVDIDPNSLLHVSLFSFDFARVEFSAKLKFYNALLHCDSTKVRAHVSCTVKSMSIIKDQFVWFEENKLLKLYINLTELLNTPTIEDINILKKQLDDTFNGSIHLRYEFAKVEERDFLQVYGCKVAVKDFHSHIIMFKKQMITQKQQLKSARSVIKDPKLTKLKLIRPAKSAIKLEVTPPTSEPILKKPSLNSILSPFLLGFQQRLQKQKQTVKVHQDNLSKRSTNAKSIPLNLKKAEQLENQRSIATNAIVSCQQKNEIPASNQNGIMLPLTEITLPSKIASIKTDTKIPRSTLTKNDLTKSQSSASPSSIKNKFVEVVIDTKSTLHLCLLNLESVRTRFAAKIAPEKAILQIERQNLSVSCPEENVDNINRIISSVESKHLAKFEISLVDYLGSCCDVNEFKKLVYSSYKRPRNFIYAFAKNSDILHVHGIKRGVEIFQTEARNKYMALKKKQSPQLVQPLFNEITSSVSKTKESISNYAQMVKKMFSVVSSKGGNDIVLSFNAGLPHIVLNQSSNLIEYLILDNFYGKYFNELSASLKANFNATLEKNSDGPKKEKNSFKVKGNIAERSSALLCHIREYFTKFKQVSIVSPERSHKRLANKWKQKDPNVLIVDLSKTRKRRIEVTGLCVEVDELVNYMARGWNLEYLNKTAKSVKKKKKKKRLGWSKRRPVYRDKRVPHFGRHEINLSVIVIGKNYIKKRELYLKLQSTPKVCRYKSRSKKLSCLNRVYVLRLKVQKNVNKYPVEEPVKQKRMLNIPNLAAVKSNITINRLHQSKFLNRALPSKKIPVFRQIKIDVAKHLNLTNEDELKVFNQLLQYWLNYRGALKYEFVTINASCFLCVSGFDEEVQSFAIQAKMISNLIQRKKKEFVKKVIHEKCVQAIKDS